VGLDLGERALEPAQQIPGAVDFPFEYVVEEPIERFLARFGEGVYLLVEDL